MNHRMKTFNLALNSEEARELFDLVHIYLEETREELQIQLQSQHHESHPGMYEDIIDVYEPVLEKLSTLLDTIHESEQNEIS